MSSLSPLKTQHKLPQQEALTQSYVKRQKSEMTRTENAKETQLSQKAQLQSQAQYLQLI